MQSFVLAEWDSRGYHSDKSGGLSLAVLFFGLLHAIPVLIIAAHTRSKILTLLAAAGSAIFAVKVGGSAYAAVDLIFVGIGTYLAFKLHLDSEQPVLEDRQINTRNVGTTTERLPETSTHELRTSDEIELKVKQFWIQKHHHLSGAYDTPFPDNEVALVSADAVFEWVKQMFPNYAVVARGLATMWGKKAHVVVKDAYDYLAAEKLISSDPSHAAKLDVVLKNLEVVADRKMARIKTLGQLVLPTEREAMQQMDLIAFDRALDFYALGIIKDVDVFRKRLEKSFGDRTNEALKLYERTPDELVGDSLLDDNSTDYVINHKLGK